MKAGRCSISEETSGVECRIAQSDTRTSKSIRIAVLCQFLIVAACLPSLALFSNVPSQAEEAFQAIFEGVPLNDSLELQYVEDPEAPPWSNVVRFVLTNTSEESVAFGPDYGARVFVLTEDGKGWREVRNTMGYVGDGEILEPRQGPTSNWGTIVVAAPEDEVFARRSVVRIAVFGRIVEDGQVTDKVVGAYATLEIEPARRKVRQIDP